MGFNNTNVQCIVIYVLDSTIQPFMKWDLKPLFLVSHPSQLSTDQLRMPLSYLMGIKTSLYVLLSCGIVSLNILSVVLVLVLTSLLLKLTFLIKQHFSS